MTAYVFLRLVQAAVTVFVISLVVFFLVRLGGDPITAMAPPTMSVEQVEELRRAWGFELPLLVQYLTFLKKAITGDFGVSVQQGIPAHGAGARSAPLDLPAGVDRAHRAGGRAAARGAVGGEAEQPAGPAGTILATVGSAMPSFWLGLMLILVFSVMLRLLPAFGSESVAAFIMPSVTLGLGQRPGLSRLTRSAMLDVLAQDYVRTAYSKGLANRSVIWGHALRTPLFRCTTVAGLEFGWLLGGAVVVESVFAWPGLGRLMVDAIQVRDIARSSRPGCSGSPPRSCSSISASICCTRCWTHGFGMPDLARSTPEAPPVCRRSPCRYGCRPVRERRRCQPRRPGERVVASGAKAPGLPGRARHLPAPGASTQPGRGVRRHHRRHRAAALGGRHASRAVRSGPVQPAGALPGARVPRWTARPTC